MFVIMGRFKLLLWVNLSFLVSIFTVGCIIIFLVLYIISESHGLSLTFCSKTICYFWKALSNWEILKFALIWQVLCIRNRINILWEHYSKSAKVLLSACHHRAKLALNILYLLPWLSKCNWKYQFALFLTSKSVRTQIKDLHIYTKPKTAVGCFPLKLSIYSD